LQDDRNVPFNIMPSKEVVAEGAYSVGAVFSLDYLDPDSLQTDDLDTLRQKDVQRRLSYNT